jgi:hypothetical protein
MAAPAFSAEEKSEKEKLIWITRSAVVGASHSGERLSRG